MNKWTGNILCLLACLLISTGCPTESTLKKDMTKDTKGTDSFTSQDGYTPTTNHPPNLMKIGDKVATVGKNLSFVIEATDEDGDNLYYSVVGKLPPGANFEKGTREFSWTPQNTAETTVVGKSFYVTFRVTDGQDFDSETVRITVTETSENLPPAFEAVNDQSAQVGKELVIQLEASDPNGDTLIYSIAGETPAGASMDPKRGIFTWTPGTADEGKTIRVTFEVSDGSLKDSVDVKIVVSGGTEPQNQPPTFKTIPAKTVKVGENLTFKVEATDPDSEDTLTYGTKGDLPQGATFDAGTQTFSWTPVDSQKDQTYQITFTVTDGELSANLTVSIQVVSDAPPPTCTPDAFEPNGKLADAKSITSGEFSDLSLCDTTDNPVDTDLFKITLKQGEGLKVTINFKHAEGDLDLALYSEADTSQPLLVSDSVTDTESVVLNSAATAGSYYIMVYGVSDQKYATMYSLTIEVFTGAVCQDDQYDTGGGNNDMDTATPLTSGMIGTDISNLKICPNNPDYYKLDLGCGGTISVKTSFTWAQGNDIDLYLLSSDNVNPPLARSETDGDNEELSYGPLSESLTLYVLVQGYPLQSSMNSYTLRVNTQGGSACTDDDLEPNNDTSGATPLPDEYTKTGLKICCDPDYFVIALTAQDGFMAEATITSGDISMQLQKSDGTIVKDSTKVDSVRSLDFSPVSTSGNYYLVINSVNPGAAYNLETLVIPAATGLCTLKSCPKDTVCDLTHPTQTDDDCVSDYCSDLFDTCPKGGDNNYSCVDEYCVNPCVTDNDCRSGYKCKVFKEGKFCGVYGTKKTAEACSYFSNCELDLVCLFQDVYSPSCGRYGCASTSDCPTNTVCVTYGDGTASEFNFCGKNCTNASTDCRTDYSCASLPKVGATGNADVCAP